MQQAALSSNDISLQTSRHEASKLLSNTRGGDSEPANAGKHMPDKLLLLAVA